MHSKPSKLDPPEIADIGAEILQSIKDIKGGKGNVVVSTATEAREATGMSESQFASLLGVSVRTLKGWQQGRKQPSGAARTLLTIAYTNPNAVLDVYCELGARSRACPMENEKIDWTDSVASPSGGITATISALRRTRAPGKEPLKKQLGKPVRRCPPKYQSDVVSGRCE